MRGLIVAGFTLTLGCNAVPDLYVIAPDATANSDAADASFASDAMDAGDGNGGADAVGDAAVEGCTGVSCPACPPNPGTCCEGGVACIGDNCANDCAACEACAPGVCCSKQGGAPVCRAADAGKCPP